MYNEHSFLHIGLNLLSVEIQQINGIKDRKIDINNSEDQIVVDTRDWRPGIYIISLIVNEKIIESVKFVVMH